MRNVAIAERRRLLKELCELMLKLGETTKTREALMVIHTIGLWMDHSFRGDEDCRPGVN